MSGSPSDTIEGASFSVMVPGPDSGKKPVYSDLARLGAVDATDEPQLPVNPNKSSENTFGDDSVGSPFAPGGLTYTVNTIQQVGPQGYLRVGVPSDYEWWLTNDPTDPQPPTKPKGGTTAIDLDPPLGGNGVALHSSNQISLFAPTINQTQNTRLNVTWSSSDRIGILSGTTEDGAGTLTNATYQVVDDLTSTVGNVLNTVAGQSATVWTGADASTGVGSLLWSNFGATQNVFAGMITNMTNGTVEVQGWGSTKFSDQEMYAPESILLAVSGAAAPISLASRFTKATIAINAVSAGLIGVVATVVAAETGIAADKAAKDKSGKDALMTALDAFKDEMWVLTGLVAALQIAGTALGIVLANASIPAASDAASKIEMTNGSIVLTAGGTTVTIDGTGFTVNAGDPADVALAATQIGTVSVQAPLVVANQATLSTPGGVAQGLLAMLPPMPVQNVTLSASGVFSAAGTQITFTLPLA